MKFVVFALPALLLAGCTAVSPPRVQRVEFGRSIWSDGQRRAGVIFQDGAQAIPLPEGTLWTFGDTFIGQPQLEPPPQNSQIQGSVWATMAWLPAGNTNLPPQLAYLTGTNRVAACPLALFPDEDQKHLRLWPLDGICLDSRVYLYYSMIETSDQPGPWNFHGVGAGLAVAGVPVKEFRRLHTTMDMDAEDKAILEAEPPVKEFQRLRPGGQSRFPVAPSQILRRRQTLYLYEVSGQPKGLILARVSVKRIEDPAAYEFFAGDDWSTNRAGAKVILREAYGQVSIAWVPALRRYVMATSSDTRRPHEIQLRESRRPEGPWSEPTRITVPEMPGKKTQLVYCTFLHPELSDARTLRLVATFCRVLDGNWELSNPEWLTITLAAE